MDELQAYLQQEAEKDRRAAGLEASLRRGMTRNPDEYAKALTLAAKTGKAPALVGEFLPEVEQEDRLRSLDVTGLIQSHPKAAAWLSDENNASIAHDDVENLARIESIPQMSALRLTAWDRVKDVGRRLVDGTLFMSQEEAQDVRQARSAVRQAGLKGTGDITAMHPLRLAAATARGFVNPLTGLASFVEAKTGAPRSTSGALKSLTSALTPEDATIAEKASEGVSSSFGLLLPGMGARYGALKLASKVPALARWAPLIGATASASVEAASEAGSVYDTLREQGQSHEFASGRANKVFLGNLAFLAATNRIGFFNPEGKSAAHLARTMLAEGTQEGVQKVVSNLGTDTPERHVGALEGVLEEAAMGGLSAGILERGGQAISSLLKARRVGGRRSNLELFFDLQASMEGADAAQALGDAARDSKLRQRSPEAFGQAVQTMVEGTDHENVMIPAERFETFFQEKGVDPAQVAEQLGARNYLEALAAGTDVVIPTASYARDIAGTDLHAELAPDIRFRPWDMSPRELEAYQAQAAQVEPEVQQQAQEAAAAAPAWWAIQEKTQAQLEAAGFEPKTAEAYATLHAKAMTNLAERSGIDPAALDARYALEVSRPAPGETPAMSLADAVLARLKTTQPGEDITQPVQPLRLDELGFWQGPVDQPAPKGVHFDNLTPEAQQRVVKGIESDIQTWVDDPQGFVNAYAAFPQSMGGRLVNGDIINAMMPAVAENVPLGLAAMKQVDAALQSQVITLHKHLRQHAYDLAGDLPVGITAGAQASGKTRTAEWLLGDGIMGAVIDAPHDDAKTVNHYIQEALGRGKDAAVVFVDRPDFGASFKSMLRRSTREGRMVPPGGMMDTRLKVPGEMLKVAQEHRNSHRVSLYHLKAAENGQPSIVGGSLAEDGKDAAISIRERAAEDRSALATQAREAYLSYLKGPNEPELPADIRRDLEAAFPGGVGENAGGAGVVGADAGAGGSAAPGLQPELQARTEGLNQALKALGINPEEVADGPELLARIAQAAKDHPELADLARDLGEALGGTSLGQSNLSKRMRRLALNTKAAQAKHEIQAHDAEEAEFSEWEKDIKALQAGEVFPTDNRGFIRFGPDRTFHIGLLQDADLSTFVHETGHFYLEVLGDLAEMEGVNPQVKEDHAALLKWLGVDSREQIGREQHEKFARANEAYLMEGKAPSAHLQGVFARVSNWLKLIYRSVSRLVKLNDEVRAVFDRLYASDEEIEAAKKDMGEAPLFATAEDAGMTEAEFALYSKAVAAETDTAKAALASRLNRELLRERASWWKEGLERETEAAAAEVDADPAQRAFVALTKGELQDGTPIKLSKEAIEAQFGEGFAKNLPRSFRRLYAREGGMDAEAAAEFLGFDSGEQLIEALRTLEPRKTRIKALAEARMKDRHGDLMVDGSLQDAAVEALHNQHREEVLMQELRAIRRLQAQVKPFVEQQAKEQREAERQDRRDARAATVVPPMETFRKAARELVEQQAAKDLQPYRYLVAERQLSRAALAAMAKKDYQAAGDARQKALLNHHLYLEAVKAKEEVEAIYDFGAKALKPRTQAMLGKAGAGFQEQHNAILERYEFVRVTNKELAERAESLAVWAQALAANGEEISIDPDLYREQPKNFRECTVPELRAVRDALKNIQTVARRQVELEVEGRKVDKEEAIEAMRASAYEHAKKVRPLPVDPLLKTAGDKARGLLLGGDAMLLKLEQVIDWLDGGDINGPWREHIFQPIAEAQVREYAMHQAITGKLVEAMEAMPKEQRLSMLDAYDIPGIGKVSRKMILSMALNMGNAENFEKMLKGHGWASPEGMEAVTRATGKLNRADWEFVQKTWDIINSLWPAIAELEHRMTGLEPVKVEAKPFTVTLEDGTTMALQGGYYPLAYDPERSSQGASQAGGDLSQLFEKGYVKATTSKGHTQARVNFAAPLVLDFEQVLTGHVTKVVKDLTHREAVVAVNKLITDQRVRSAIQETLGPEYEAQFLPWLRSVVNDRNGSAAQGLGGFSRFMMGMRSNMVAATIGFKISSVIVQATDLIRASDRVKKTELGKALLDFMRHPVEVTQQVREMSGEMRFRSENLDRDIRAALQRLTGKNSAWAEVQRFAFHGIGLADTITSVPTWLGAYRQALKEGAPEEQAIREADRTARLVLQVGSPKDLTPIQRQNELAKFVTMFMGDATATYGILRDAGHQVRGVKDVPKWAARVLFAVMIPAILGDLIKGQGPGDDEDKGAWAARKALLSAPNTIPVLRDMTKILDNGGSYRFSPAVSGLEKAGRLFLQTGTALDKGDWDRVAFTGADMFGTLAGVPGTAQIITSGRYLYKVHSGDERPENSMDIAKGVALGAKQKGRK
jgi:hypothetical protein